jgi:hypothetical protein
MPEDLPIEGRGPSWLARQRLDEPHARADHALESRTPGGRAGQEQILERRAL